MVIASSSSIFEKVEPSETVYYLTFKSVGIRYIVSKSDEEFVSEYGQKIHVDFGESLTLIEKHSKYLITAHSQNNLEIKLQEHKKY